ncbi:MAG: sigma-54-dependent Fis family transcriptional regulator [Deltaproteobacteria bacterium]|nr:sigma-54-dependent Fis family transcriptional regulator [Deltaproteobacteria bacterium]
MMNGQTRILVVDDELHMRSALADWLGDEGYDVVTAAGGEEAIRLFGERPADLLLLDLKMPGIDGIETMRRIRTIGSSVPVIIITAYATIETAVAAMKVGAADYLVKPVNPEELSVIVRKLVTHQQVLQENIALRKQLEKSYEFHDLLSKNARMQEIFSLVRSAAQSSATVLIQGESGTGKELVARAIHRASDRAKGPFLAISCGALAESLCESELFGHEKGAFTDAKFLKRGKIELADKGTLFFDEIGDLGPKMQVDLLRFLQTRELQRVGGNEVLRVDVRVVAATNRPLEHMVEEGTFRRDLYYRLNVISVFLPPLRERREDIPLLGDHFLRWFAAHTRKNVERISSAAMGILARYHWPGNVRELENVVERAVVLCGSNLITPEDLPEPLRQPQALVEAGPDATLEAVERAHIERVLAHNGWNIQRSAEILGIDRMTLYRKIRRFNLVRTKPVPG